MLKQSVTRVISLLLVLVLFTGTAALACDSKSRSISATAVDTTLQNGYASGRAGGGHTIYSDTPNHVFRSYLRVTHRGDTIIDTMSSTSCFKSLTVGDPGGTVKAYGSGICAHCYTYISDITASDSVW